MALQQLVGSGLWLPSFPEGTIGDQNIGLSNITLDADEEECQVIGRVVTDDHGSHTFGTSGSSIGWFPNVVTFQASATLTIGIKSAAAISTTTGPPARATIGAGAFNIFKALIGGTD